MKVFARDKNKNEAKLKYQGQSARSQRWFDLDSNWIEVNFSTREPDFYKIFFQNYDDTHDTNTYKRFQVPIGNSKCVETSKFNNDTPILKYCQKSLNSCFLSSLVSAFASINQNKADDDISLSIEEYLGSEVGNCIDFANAILKSEKRRR